MNRPPEQSPDRVTQLEQALAYSREMYAELRSQHETAQRLWASANERLLARIEDLETRLLLQSVVNPTLKGA